MQAPYPIRVLGEDEWPKVVEVDGHAFGSTLDPEVAEHYRAVQDPGRTIAACDGDTIAGVATAFSFEVTAPGAVIAAAGVSWVGVLPVYRRRGVLRSMMRHQLRDIRNRGHEAIAILWASEPPIYGRFGYGLATRAVSLEVPRSTHAMRDDAPHDPALRLRLVAPDDWKTTAGVYDDVASRRPGMLARDDRWHVRAVLDLPMLRDGKSPLRCVIAEDATTVRGYARYSTKRDWSTDAGTVYVREVIAADAAALAALYRYLFDLDLMTATDLWNVPFDDPVLHWLRNVRTAKPRLHDALYVRLVDVRRALAERCYAHEVDTIIGVEDSECPWNAGLWRVVGGRDGASCEPAAAGSDPDLSLSVTDLGAVYLGGTTLHELAAAGRVRELRGGALNAASAAFSWTPAPWCPVVF